MIGAHERKRLVIEGVTSTASPSGAVLAIDDVEYPCTLSTTGTGPYTVTATTSAYFAGPAHLAPAGATVLSLGVHTIELRVDYPDNTRLTKQYPSFRI